MPQINLPGGAKLQRAGNQSCRPRELEGNYQSLEVLLKSISTYIYT